MTEPKAQKRSEPTQRQRFIKTARELGCEENEQAFDAALKKVAKAKVARPKGEAKKTKAK